MASALDSIAVETLLKAVAALAIVWLVLEILGELLSITLGLFGFLQPVLALAVVVLVLLWLLD